jgi:acyl-CoA synthetase (AMP-forming)/AMP-acid ligase II
MPQDRSIASDSLVLNRLLTRNARYRPDHPALVVGELRLTWAELDAQVNRWAKALVGLGVRRGDRVATLLTNCAELSPAFIKGIAENLPNAAITGPYHGGSAD